MTAATTAAAAVTHQLVLTDWSRTAWSAWTIRAAFEAHLPGALVLSHRDDETGELTITVRGAALDDVDAAAELYLDSALVTYRTETTGAPS